MKADTHFFLTPQKYVGGTVDCRLFQLKCLQLKTKRHFDKTVWFLLSRETGPFFKQERDFARWKT